MANAAQPCTVPPHVAKPSLTCTDARARGGKLKKGSQTARHTDLSKGFFALAAGAPRFPRPCAPLPFLAGALLLAAKPRCGCTAAGKVLYVPEFMQFSCKSHHATLRYAPRQPCLPQPQTQKARLQYSELRENARHSE